LLGRLAGQPGLLPLSLHVDYWNRTGWEDPYSSAAITARQYAYAQRLGQYSVFTPELVVNGAESVVGSDQASVDAAIRRARAAQAVSVPLSAAREGGVLRIMVGAGSGRASVFVLGYDDRHVTPVRGGENAGRTLTETDVVRSLAAVGSWTGDALDVRVAAPAGEHAAVLLQADGGRMLAASVVQ